MRFIALLETARRHGIGEDKERSRPRTFHPVVRSVGCIHDRASSGAAHGYIAVGLSVNGVTESHVIGGHGLRDRAGCAADAKKLRATSCPAPISAKVPYFAESKLIWRAFSIGADRHPGIDIISLAAIHGRRKRCSAKQRRLACPP